MFFSASRWGGVAKAAVRSAACPIIKVLLTCCVKGNELSSEPGSPVDNSEDRTDRSSRTRDTALPGPSLPGENPASLGAAAERRVLIFVCVSLALLMSSLNQTIVATALHSIQIGLASSIAWTGWTITAYSLGMVLMLPLAGKLSDRYGRRRVFLGSVIVFTLGSLFCGFSNNIYVLVVLRAVQAIGGAGFTPSATGIVVEHFGSARDRAVGLFGSIFPIGSILGPIVGGVIVTYWSWRVVFLVNVPIGILLTLLALRVIPVDRSVRKRSGESLDLGGMALLGVGVLSAMIALTFLGGTHSGSVVFAFVSASLVCVIALWLFVAHINRSRRPFISPSMLYGRGFGAVNVINFVFGGGLVGLVALIPFYATTRYGIGALDSGTLLTAQGIGIILVSSFAAFLLRRTGYRLPMYVGYGLAATGIGLLAVPPAGLSPYVWLASAACLVGIGIGCADPASRNACLQLVPDQSSALAALRSTGRQVGSIVTVSVATAIIAGFGTSGTAQAYVYAAAALLLLAATPIISRVPEHHGAW